MANRRKCHLTLSFLFLLSYYTAATVVTSTLPRQYTSSDYPQPHDFPNESLYQAYFVIQRFKKTITCDPKNITSTWTGHDICGATTYVGFYCTTLPGHGQKLAVTSSLLDGFGLCAPQLQGFIDQLPDLALFQATNNNFGALDVLDLAALNYHYKLDTIDDHLPQILRPSEYTLPTKDLANANLCLLYHKFCVTIGSVSPKSTPQKADELGATNARAVLLNNDNLSGLLPANIGFSRLSYLALANNKLTGPIPPSISHLQDSLFEVLLFNNQLSGCLPHELGMLHKATVIDAGKNQLTGPIPSSFSCLSSVEQLNLGENRLYGQVPDALCKLAAGPAGRLANLTLSGNYFTSVGPACAALIKDGVLDVKNNCIPGIANQRKPAECAAFQSQPKTCPAAASTQVACPAGAATGAVAAAPGKRKAREYSSYVTYATLHE